MFIDMGNAPGERVQHPVPVVADPAFDFHRVERMDSPEIAAWEFESSSVRKLLLSFHGSGEDPSRRFRWRINRRRLSGQQARQDIPPAEGRSCAASSANARC